MSLREFENLYKTKLKKFQGFQNNSIVSKAYSRLLKGSEIKFNEYSNEKDKYSLMELLVEIPQLQLVKDDICLLMDNVFTTKDFAVKIVYGDYGQGKSQTAQILFDFLKNRKGVREDIIHLESISTFRRFIYNVSYSISDHIRSISKHYYTQVEPFVKTLERAEDNDVSIQDLITQFIDLSKEISSRENQIIVIILDEFDKILIDDKDSLYWVDFFRSITDETEIPILLTCFTPQQSVKNLLAKYEQMGRWQNFFSTTAVYLDGKFGEESEKALSNLLAINSIYYSINYDEIDLESWIIKNSFNSKRLFKFQALFR